jgi:hypothetical protein
MGFGVNLDIGSLFPSQTSTGQAGTSQKVLSQEGINKLIYDVLSSDQGLAALAGPEGLSGGGKSSTKALMAQDLVTKLVGELANVTAPTVTTQQSTSSKKMSVVCTELHRQGYIKTYLYKLGQEQFHNRKLNTIIGYQKFAAPFVERMKTDPVLCARLLKWVHAYYYHVLYNSKSLRSCLIMYLARPICYLYGFCTLSSMKDNYAGS